MPVPFDARALCERVAARRGRPIRLIPMARLTGICGVWIATSTMDLIFYERETTRPHQDHIILHELSHLLCDHYTASFPVTAKIERLLPSLDPEMVRRLLARAGYSTFEEREAETLASLIRQRARTHAGDTIVDRLHTALDDSSHG
jgi:hypothetical protein